MCSDERDPGKSKTDTEQAGSGGRTAPDDGTRAGSDDVLSVAVRTLCAFAARQGDLDLRFTPSPSAQQGREGHLLIARRRGESYETEITLSAHCAGLHLKGRADGYEPRNRELEEIKTHRGRVEDIPANHRTLHRAQARLYAWMLCLARDLPSVTVSVVYLEIGSLEESRYSEELDRDALQVFAESLCARYVAWAQSEARHRKRRQDWLQQITFPRVEFREGQRDLAAAVWRACTRGESLRIQAPTGLGKTLGTLYPALRAMAVRPLDRIAVLSARTTARKLALDAIGEIKAKEAPDTIIPLRVIEIVARERACEHPDKACHGESCPLARGFYDRLPGARHDAAQADLLDQAHLRDIALAHRICPYFLSMEMLRWADVAIGDYHYWFDRHATLAALAIDQEWRVAVLVDEAHQLVPRARAMYSATSSLSDLLALRKTGPRRLRGSIDALINQWDLLCLANPDEDPAHALSVQLDELPAGWLRALQTLATDLGELLAESAPSPAPALLEAYFDSLSFLALADALGEHSLVFFERQGDAASIAIRNVIPAPFLRSRIAATDSLVMFSATMHPAQFDRDLLGLAESTPTLEFDSPFDASRFSVSVLPISTRLQDRPVSLDRLVRAMAAQIQRTPGNYLAFFSSFDYLERALQHFRQRNPEVSVWTQTRVMNESQRADFLARFSEAGSGIGFAVLGGAFGEGIDLPGRRLIGAFIATLGFPQVDTVNEAMAARMETLFGAGHEYTYVIPGLQKVVQAAGRVIRTPEDRGSLLLMDARYSWPRYRALLPRSWGLHDEDNIASESPSRRYGESPSRR